MRMRRPVLIAFGLLFAAVTVVRGDEAAQARKIVEASIEAVGGEAKVSRCKVVVSRGEGNLYGGGRTVPCTFRHVYQLPAHYSLTVVAYDFETTTVLNGERGWVQLNATTTAMSKEQLRESRVNLFIDRVVTLVPLLKDKGFTLSLLKDVAVDGAAAVGVNVRYKACRDVKLYFCKKSRLLIRMLMTVKGARGEVEEEVLFRDYADFAGVLRPRKIVTRRNQKNHASWQVTEYQALEKRLDERDFAKP